MLPPKRGARPALFAHGLSILTALVGWWWRRRILHPFQQGGRKLLPFSRDALLMRLEIRDALSNLIAPIWAYLPMANGSVRWPCAARAPRRWRAVRRVRRGFCKYHRFLDKCVNISFLINHFKLPQHIKLTRPDLRLPAPYP